MLSVSLITMLLFTVPLSVKFLCPWSAVIDLLGGEASAVTFQQSRVFMTFPAVAERRQRRRRKRAGCQNRVGELKGNKGKKWRERNQSRDCGAEKGT